MRPTGRLHIGHYFGALQNWVRLQSDPAYECFYFVADWHALTSDYADTSAIAENSLQITIDFLAAGLDPQKSTIFLQSLVPEHAELHLLLSMVTPLGWLERIPTYKEQIENVTNKDLHTYGFLGYPTLQTADIVIYSPQPEPDAPASTSSPGTVSASGVGAALGRPSLLVPVGEDQVSHVEFSRELVRRFNLLYCEIELQSFDEEMAYYGLATKLGVPHDLNHQILKSASCRAGRSRQLLVDHIQTATLEAKADYLSAGLRDVARIKTVLEEPGHLLTPTPRLPGLDGRKMSKSYGNAIALSESDDDIRKKTKVMVTDPARKRRTDPGNPDVCPVFDWHKLFSTEERDPGRIAWVRQGCTTAGIGCIECKSAMAENLIKWIAPVRERRLQYEHNQKSVLKILDEGSERARESAKLTMQRVRNAIFHWPLKRNL